MKKLVKSKPSAPVSTPAGPLAPGGGASGAALQMAQPKGPGGAGFLINHNAFSDAAPVTAPSSRGMRKSAGYPNFVKNP